MRNAVYAVIRAIAVGAAAVGCFFDVAYSAQEALPRSAEQLTPPKLHSHLSSERLSVLVGRWIAQIDPADVDGSIAAIDLLGSAPSEFVGAAASRLRQSGALEKVFAAGNEPQKGKLRNSAVTNRSGLRDLLWHDYLQSLASALSAGSEIDILASIPNAEFMSSLPAPVAKALVGALENEKLGDQARNEISKLLIKKWNSLKEEVPRLHGWLSEQGVEGDALVTRKRVARSVLVLRDEPLSSADLDTLIWEGDTDPRIAALDRLKSSEPQRWARLYDDVKQTTALASWDLVSVNWFIEAAGPEQTAALDGWSATIKLSPSSTEAIDCPDLRWRLSLLSRQSAPHATRFETLWNLLSKRSSCRDDNSLAVDKALVAVAGGDLGTFIATAVDRDGPGQFANAPLRLPSLSRFVSELLAGRLTRDGLGAERLLDLGVVPFASDLAKQGYWTKVFGPQPIRAMTAVDLRVLQAVDGPPLAAYAAAVRLAKDETASVPLRGAALLALGGHAGPDLDALIGALSDSSAAVSRPALILLARAYDAAPTSKSPFGKSRVGVSA